jgi:N-formylglutamate deformylase
MDSQAEKGNLPGDAVLASLFAEPCRIRRPERQSVPFIFASPHSGRLYPPSFIAKSALDALCLRRSEDAFVDELFAGVVALGAPLIAARFPRAFLDVNRAPGEIDATMFDGALGLAVDIPGPRVNAGLGVIPRVVRDGAEIYKEKLAPAEADERLARLHQPYHAALAGLVEETRARFGVAVVVDCHSMPSAAAVPDIVLGDRHGAAASPALTRWAESVFERRGFSLARNTPYAGGYTTALHGRRERGTQALQIEVNRSLYLDEESIERIASFAALQVRLNLALAELTAIDPKILGAGGQTAYAAE